MPHSNTEQTERREAIRELLADGPVDTQQVIVDMLTSRGLAATQSSVSRDLRDLGAIKTPDGYSLPRGDHNGELHAVEQRGAGPGEGER